MLIRKKIGIIALILSSVMLLSGCGSKDNSSNSGAKSDISTEISVVFMTFGETPKDMQAVQDEINKISEEKINVTVKFTPIAVGSYAQQMNLMLASNEKLDLFATGNLPTVFDYNGQVAKGQLAPLNDLIDKYGADLKEAVGDDYLEAAKSKGKTYAIPTVRDLASSRGLVIRKDIVTKYNIDLNNIKTVEDIEATLKTIKAKEPDFTPYGNGAGQTIVDSFKLPNGDMLNDCIGVLMTKDDTKIVNYFESDEYKSLINTARRWYTSGLVMKDIATTKDSSETLIKSNKIYAYGQSLKPGIDGQLSRLAGMEMVTKEITPVSTDTQKATSFMWAIPSNSQKSEAAFKFLNLMYTNKDVVNLIDNGIEGKHYAKVSGTDNIIEYPAGVDAKSTGYGLNLGFEFGNQFLSYVWKGDSPTLWQDMDAFNKSAIKSKAFGFMFDTTPVKSEYASVSNAISEYKTSLENGTVDPEQKLPEFISKLKAAGIDKIIAEKQKQFDEFLK